MRIDRIKFNMALLRADMKALDLASRAGVSRGTVTAVKSGKSCSEATAHKLAEALGVPIEQIVERGR